MRLHVIGLRTHRRAAGLLALAAVLAMSAGCVRFGGKPPETLLTITPQAGDPQTLRWNAGQATLEWPAGIPVVDGSSYQINWTGGTSPTRLTARSLTGVAASDLEAVATALATNRCQSQLEVFIAAQDADATAGGGRSGGTPAPR